MFDQLPAAIDSILEFLLNLVVQLLPRLLISALVVALALYLGLRVQRAAERAVERNGGRRALSMLVGRIARWGVLLAAALAVLTVFNLDEAVATFLTGLGITGLVIAFALQDLSKNFAAGALLSIQNPFSIGDRIKVRDYEGIVVDITMRTTAIKTLDGFEVLVPNADVYTSPIYNFSRYPLRRHHVLLTLPAAIAAEPARARLEAVLRATPGPESEPAPTVLMTGATNDAVSLDITYWLPSGSPSDEVTTSVLARLHDAIDELKREATPATERI